MAISIYLGMTESGKSHLANKQLERVNRSVVFDFAHCFEGDVIITDFSNTNIVNLFNKFKDRKKFKIIFRPVRGIDVETAFNKVAWFTLLLGRQAIKNNFSDRLIFIVDEADEVCKSNYQSEGVKNVVNWGRHELVDSWFIARTPQRIHTDIRANASKIFSFKLIAESSLKYFRDMIDSKAAERIKNLGKYHFLAWKSSGEVQIFNEKQNPIESWS